MQPRAWSRISVSVTWDGNGALVTAEGELDRSTAKIFDDRLSKVLASGRSPVAVDLGGISFIDVSGYRAMARFSERCRREGVENVWLPPSRSVQLLWRILGPPGGTIDGDGEGHWPAATAPLASS
jgi:anti-anti-sigma factor